MSTNALLRVAARSGRWAVVQIQPRAPLAAFYSSTPMRLKKVDQEDEEVRKLFENMTIGKIQTMNTDISEEEAMKILEEELALLQEAEDAKFLGDWKPGLRKRPLVSTKTLEEFEAELEGKSIWTLRDKRCGALGIKLGMPSYLGQLGPTPPLHSSLPRQQYCHWAQDAGIVMVTWLSRSVQESERKRMSRLPCWDSIRIFPRCKSTLLTSFASSASPTRFVFRRLDRRSTPVTSFLGSK